MTLSNAGKLMLLTSAFALSVGSAMAQASWDQNADGSLNPQEFVSGFGALDKFSTFDADGSVQLDQAEWDTGLRDVGEYANMDLNGDGGVRVQRPAVQSLRRRRVGHPRRGRDRHG